MLLFFRTSCLENTAFGVGVHPEEDRQPRAIQGATFLMDLWSLSKYPSISYISIQQCSVCLGEFDDTLEKNPANHLGCPKCWFYPSIKTFSGIPSGAGFPPNSYKTLKKCHKIHLLHTTEGRGTRG